MPTRGHFLAPDAKQHIPADGRRQKKSFSQFFKMNPEASVNIPFNPFALEGSNKALAVPN